ncbi:class I SAM-dependent methyltransferase [Alicyclobacillus sp.]|uniref:class I SAM-dependent methyltransferase n=1 Tax=Alicyclobacillus sp. TaxID=61169 RepID=UPI0025BD0605|nr:class I SAM-dependent methyltransferase [Alicyclobacillus sp.]MCL6517951.1 class I SAM-dependent methyltransferase [Alicyclobacillus sp.]
MRIPNFNTEEGSILYSDTVGRQIAPRVGEQLFQSLRPTLDNRPNARILDLGCGPGTLTLPIARLYPEASILATDASPAMIQLCQSAAAREGLNNIEARVMNANHMDLDPNSFHLVVCNLAFPFFARPDESVAALREVLHPDGEVWFSVPGRETWAEFFAIAERVMGDAVRVAKPFLAKFTQSEHLPGSLRTAGFTVEERRVKLPFHFSDGPSVLSFFGQLFHLLDYAPEVLREELARAIESAAPDGFTMHYEAVILRGIR